MSDIIKFTIPGKPEYVQMLRLAIGSVAGQAEFDVEEIEDIKVAVAEACKLVTCHGQSGFSESYDVSLEVFSEKIEITVSDLTSEHLLEKYCTQCIRCPEDGDLSVFVMDSLMDDITVIKNPNGSKSIKMVKNR